MLVCYSEELQRSPYFGMPHLPKHRGGDVSGTPAKERPCIDRLSEAREERSLYVHIAVEETNEGRHLYAAAERRATHQRLSDPRRGQASSYAMVRPSTGTGSNHSAEAVRNDPGAGC